jgi:hypothetical protein
VAAGQGVDDPARRAHRVRQGRVRAAGGGGGRPDERVGQEQRADRARARGGGDVGGAVPGPVGVGGQGLEKGGQGGRLPGGLGVGDLRRREGK